MNRQYWILFFGWIIFGVLHSLGASTVFKKFIQRLTPALFKYYRLFYTVAAVINMAVLIIYQCLIKSQFLFITRPWLNMIALSVGAVGLYMMLVTMYKYFYQLSGVALLKKQESKPELYTGGLNGLVRHPLYAGTLLFLWSLFFVYPLLSLLVSNTVITLYTLAGIHFEEKKLLSIFGDAYRSYKQKVPMLLPFLQAFRNGIQG